MPSLNAAVEAYREAVSKRDEASVTALARFLSDDVRVVGLVGAGAGRDAVLASLANPAAPRILAAAEWSAPRTQDGFIILEAKLPPGANLAAVTSAIRLDASGCITEVLQQMVPNPPAPPAKLALTQEIKDAVNGALANGTPVIISYVDAQGQPHMSPRGTAQAFSDDQLALWNRDPEGGMTRGIAVNPKVALFYRDPPKRTTYTFYGRARVATEPADRDRIYENSPEVERNFDAMRRGLAVIIDLDLVEGAGPSGRVRMARQP
jgi:hypothetical protein